MQDDLLPLFPLSLVLLPGSELPLHIFEDRYKEMIGLALEYKTEFGIVQVVNAGIARVGCTASVDRVTHRYEDGRLDIQTTGRRRFHVNLLDQQQSYLRASVAFFDDEEAGASGELCAEAIEAMGASEIVRPQLSFRLAEGIDDLDFCQSLLQMRSEPERLRRIIRYAPSHRERRKAIEYVQQIAPKNGHKKH